MTKQEFMIKLFRKIRQDLLSQNKLKNYLIYVIVEIKLVVMRILLAIRINHKNETHKDYTVVEEISLKLIRDGVS